MTRALLAFVAFFLPAAAIGGPISKWENRRPDRQYVSSTNIFDAERCIIDAEGWSGVMVYRQPDRPDQVMLVYFVPNGGAGARIDLVTRPDGLHVTAWSGPKAVLECAPPKGDVSK